MNELITELVLPWPPTVNHLYKRRFGHSGYYLPKSVQDFRWAVKACWMTKRKATITSNAGLRIEIGLYPPDKRVRDIDNVLKSLLDSFTHAGIIDDDRYIKQLHIERFDPKNDKNGICKVKFYIIN